MLVDHDALVRNWKKDAARREDANFRFLRRLKMVDDPDEVDKLAHKLHVEAFARIDCTRCANCCKTISPGLNDLDVERIAAQQNLTRQEFIDAYLKPDPDSPSQFLMKRLPCPFLGADDRCTIYSVRPDSCREFPHTDKAGFIGRVYGHAANSVSCPAVYSIVDEMRKALG
jgi:uncharacterized protein